MFAMGFIKFILKAVIGTVIAVVTIVVIIGVIAGNAGSKPVAAATVAATSTPAPIAATSAPAPTPKPVDAPAAPAPTEAPAATGPADIGDTVTNGNWQLTLNKVEQADVLGKTAYSAGKAAQGKYVIVTVTAKNLDKATSTISDHDFTIKSPDGVNIRLPRTARAQPCSTRTRPLQRSSGSASRSSPDCRQLSASSSMSILPRRTTTWPSTRQPGRSTSEWLLTHTQSSWL